MPTQEKIESKEKKKEKVDSLFALASVYFIQGSWASERGRQNYKQAFTFFSMAKSMGSGYAAQMIKKCYVGDADKCPEPLNALEIWNIAADNGHLQSQLIMANTYLAGSIIQQDTEKARQYYKMAADQGSTRAMNVLSDMNIELAEKLKAACKNQQRDRKVIETAIELEREGIRMLTESAKQNDSQAQFILGTHYIEGSLVKKDLMKASELLIKSTKNDHHTAPFALAELYAEKRVFGFKSDVETILSVLEKKVTEQEKSTENKERNSDEENDADLLLSIIYANKKNKEYYNLDKSTYFICKGLERDIDESYLTLTQLPAAIQIKVVRSYLEDSDIIAIQNLLEKATDPKAEGKMDQNALEALVRINEKFSTLQTPGTTPQKTTSAATSISASQNQK